MNFRHLLGCDTIVYVPADKPYLCAQRNNCFEMIRNLKLKMLS